jgi:hypothetical protein
MAQSSYIRLAFYSHGEADQSASRCPRTTEFLFPSVLWQPVMNRRHYLQTSKQIRHVQYVILRGIVHTWTCIFLNTIISIKKLLLFITKILFISRSRFIGTNMEGCGNQMFMQFSFWQVFFKFILFSKSKKLVIV